MKKLILLLFIPLVSFGQSQNFDGISFDAPENFKLTGDLEWRNGNEAITITPYKSEDYNSEEFKSTCERKNFTFGKYQLNNQKLSICYGGDDSRTVALFVVNLDEYSFLVGAVSNDPERLAMIVKFMFESINNNSSDSVTFSDGKTVKIEKLKKDLIDVLGATNLLISKSAIDKFNKCFFENIAKNSTYTKYREDLLKSKNHSDNEDKRMYYLYSLPYINSALWGCVESDNNFINEFAKIEKIIPQSDVKIELIAKEILKDFKISLGQDEYNRLKETIDWKAFSECYVRKLWETFSPKQMNNPTKEYEIIVDEFMNDCMEQNSNLKELNRK